MISKLKLPIKKINSHHSFLKNQSFFGQKLCQNLKLNLFLNNNRPQFDIPLLNIKLSEHSLTKRKASYQSSKKLKPIIKENNKVEQIQKQMNSFSFTFLYEK